MGQSCHSDIGSMSSAHWSSISGALWRIWTHGNYSRTNNYDVFQQGCGLGHCLILALVFFPGLSLDGFGFEAKAEADNWMISSSPWSSHTCSHSYCKKTWCQAPSSRSAEPWRCSWPSHLVCRLPRTSLVHWKSNSSVYWRMCHGDGSVHVVDSRAEGKIQAAVWRPPELRSTDGGTPRKCCLVILFFGVLSWWHRWRAREGAGCGGSWLHHTPAPSHQQPG